MTKKEKKCKCKCHIEFPDDNVWSGWCIDCRSNHEKSPKPEKKATRKGVRIEEIDICDHDDSNPYLQQAPEGTGQRLKAMQQGIDYCLKCRNFYKVNSR